MLLELSRLQVLDLLASQAARHASSSLTKDERASLAQGRTAASEVTKILKASPSNSIRTYQRKKAFFAPTITVREDIYVGDDAEGGQRHVSIEQVLVDDEESADSGLGDDAPSRATHVFLSGDIVFMRAGIDDSAADGPAAATATAALWWAGVTTHVLPREQARERTKLTIIWLDPWQAPDASTGDYVLLRSRDNPAYGSILKDPDGEPIYFSPAALSPTWRQSRNIYTFSPEFLEYLDERVEAHDKSYAADRRNLLVETRGTAADDEDDDAEVDAERLNTEAVIATTTRSGRVSRPPANLYRSLDGVP